MAFTAMLTLPAADAVTHSDSSTRLIIAAVLGVAVIVVLIVWSRMHPFLALTLGSAVLAVAAGIPLTDTFKAFTRGLGSTIGDVGVLIAFGAIIGRLLIDSGGADQIVDTILARTSGPRLPWAMALIAFVVGIPLFFEVGIVLLIPVVMIVARRARQPLVLVGVPALAGLSALHGLVPPHPGPLIAIDAVGANLGMTLGLGLLVAVPTVIISGPLAARVMAGWVPVEAPEPLGGSDRAHEGPRGGRRRSCGSESAPTGPTRGRARPSAPPCPSSCCPWCSCSCAPSWRPSCPRTRPILSRTLPCSSASPSWRC